MRIPWLKICWKKFKRNWRKLDRDKCNNDSISSCIKMRFWNLAIVLLKQTQYAEIAYVAKSPNPKWRKTTKKFLAEVLVKYDYLFILGNTTLIKHWTIINQSFKTLVKFDNNFGVLLIQHPTYVNLMSNPIISNSQMYHKFFWFFKLISLLDGYTMSCSENQSHVNPLVPSLTLIIRAIN